MSTQGPPPPPRSKKSRKPAPRPPHDRRAGEDGVSIAYNAPKAEYNPYGYVDQAASKDDDADDDSHDGFSPGVAAPSVVRGDSASRARGYDDYGAGAGAAPLDGGDSPMPPAKVSLLDLEPETTIGETISIEGKLRFERLLRLDGKFEGELISAGDLIVGPTGELVGDVRGMGDVVVFGKVMGSISVDRLELRASAAIYGNVACKSLRMDPSVVLVGTLNIHPFAPQNMDRNGELTADAPQVERATKPADAPNLERAMTQPVAADEPDGVTPAEAALAASESTPVIVPVPDAPAPEALPTEGDVASMGMSAEAGDDAAQAPSPAPALDVAAEPEVAAGAPDTFAQPSPTKPAAPPAKPAEPPAEPAAAPAEPPAEPAAAPAEPPAEPAAAPAEPAAAQEPAAPEPAVSPQEATQPAADAPAAEEPTAAAAEEPAAAAAEQPPPEQAVEA
ncbi:polymer-forming cytoskeletal-domain-containing protein [Pelagophyceae sp. CCMP2097]|nr:polymer-forming cytoskeletal-domain-containing protein [Pelagophyceae sp. CCMP2097]